MGADAFTQYGFGQTMSEAFRSAHDAAAYEYGHGGYSGSLAEKHGAVEFAVPAGMTARKFHDLIAEASYTLVNHGEDIADLKRDLADAKARLAKGGLTREHRTWWVQNRNRTEKLIKDTERERKAFLRKCGRHVAAITAAARIYDQKWGDAVALKLSGAEAKQAREWLGVQRKRGNVYLFIGMASS